MKKFGWKAFIKMLAVIAAPVALQNLLTTTGSMVDTIMIVSLGETTVGAVGLCAQFTSLMFSCCWGFVGGSMLFFAQFFGAKDDDGINRLMLRHLPNGKWIKPVTEQGLAALPEFRARRAGRQA